MRLIASALPLAAVASAVVIPVPSTHKVLESWEDFLHDVPSKESVRESVDDFASTLKNDYDAITTGIEDALSSAGDSLRSTLENVFDDEEEILESLTGGHHGDDHHHKSENKTIYQVIKESKYTTKLAKLIDEHDSVVDLLNSTKANYTFFAPVDEAFERIPDHGEKPSKEFVEALLKYHVGIGSYPAGRILATHTLPTALDESWLGDRPQRLRTRVGLTGVRVNFYDKVIYANKLAKNGVIHAVKNILVPPPMVGRIISLFPSKFSTLLLAYEKTDFVKFIHNIPMHQGSTVFAPSNAAWDRLGPGTNAFLFNSEKGRKYLKALLKYHIVANSTLYSDVLYKSKGEDDEEPPSPIDPCQRVVDESNNVESRIGFAQCRVDMPTLLGDKWVGVDITRWGGFIDMKVNGFSHISVQDGVSRNGVIHVVESILFPPRTAGSTVEDDVNALNGSIELEDLKERLAPFVDEENAANEWAEL